VLQKCSSSGAFEFDHGCAKSEYCDERRAQCEPQICKPGAASCDGGAVRICNDDGSDFVPKELCSLSQVCRNGECLDIGCVPNTTFCKDGGVWTCGADGTTSALSEHCASSQFCLEKDHVASCSATQCFAGDNLCAGNLATQCAPDGSGPKPGGDDCSKANQICYSGECRDPLCTPGIKLCDNNKLYLCSDAGTAESLLSDCGDKAACDAVTGTCLPRICDPGKLSCDSTRVVTCNGSGTAWQQSGPDCAASHALCSAGACEPIICTPNSNVCNGNNLNTCSADGTSSSFYYSCSSSYHCVDSGSYYGAICSAYYCTPSAAGCNGNLLTTCKADGSAWTAGGTDCTLSNGICSNAQCKTKVCTPNTLFCSNNTVQSCDYQGISSYTYSTCGYAAYCKAQGSSAACSPTPCLPGATGCAGEKYGQCASDGLSVPTGTDCAAASQVCTTQGCAASATDSIGSSNLVAAYNYYNLFADMVDVQNTRQLTLLEAFVSLPSTRSLVWVVYQKNLVNNVTSYDLKYQKTTTGTGSGFQSSGAIAVQLDAGKTYAIGVSVSGGSFAYYYDTASSAPLLGFGAVTGGFTASFANSLSYVYPYLTTLYYVRLTTSAP
jgi:hypothetical protein